MRKLMVVSLLLAALGGSGAHAHAFLDHASPLIGSTVAASPRDVVLTFTQNLEAAFSLVQVTDANGGRVDQGKPQISGNTMRIGLKSLPQGTYRVRWRALSVDTHTRPRAASPLASAVDSFERSYCLPARHSFGRNDLGGGHGDFWICGRHAGLRRSERRSFAGN